MKTLLLLLGSLSGTNLAQSASFCAEGGCADRSFPIAGLVRDTLGYPYGTTSGPAAPPFVTTGPAIGVVGEVVTILGYGLKAATSVTFNGTPAKILSASACQSALRASARDHCHLVGFFERSRGDGSPRRE
jgi:hypothetical protein